ncbi:MAG: hypothetical protein AAF351_11695 [Pseudomonadota bacterium]
MASLTAIFGNSADKDDDNEAQSEKLLQLYWNRAELKKEFADLRSEKFRLQDRVQEEQATTARIQQKLDHLENLLLDPEWVYSIVTYYQLRGLYEKCGRKLARFAEQLKQNREKRKHSELLDDWHEQLAAEAAVVETQIGEQRLQVQLLEDRLQAERHRLATMNGFLKLFRGRSLTASLDKLAAEIDRLQREEQILLEQVEAIQGREPPDAEGLDISSKRLINNMILSFAQQLYLHFMDDDLATKIKDAGDRSVGALNYGSKATCDEILKQLRERTATLESAADFADELRQRAKLIGKQAAYRDSGTAVPTSASVATVFDITASGQVRNYDGNLLRENFWRINDVLSR